jgi:26S proteasome regulatory subunit N5
LKQATKRMVQKVMGFLDEMEYDTKMDILQALLAVTEGKIFLEKQGARLTLLLSKIRESEGKIAEAATILQEVQVETFGSMKKKEKTNYILEQMRLCLRKKDYIRAQIISRKINPKVLDDKDFQEERIKYYSYMVDYWMNERNYLEIYRSFYSIFTTPSVQADPNQWQKSLKNCVIFIVLAPYGNEQHDLIHRLATSEDRKLQHVPVMKDLVKRFLTMEVLGWTDVQTRFLPELRQLDLFQGPSAELLVSDLHVAVTEHNLRTVAAYYSKICTLFYFSDLFMCH